MPAPLLMPVMVTVRPPIDTWREVALGRVSVVMIASAANAQLPAFRSATAAGRPATMRSLGSVSMITPVENGSTCCGCRPNRPAVASQTCRARASPSSPVPALALPVLITSAPISAPPAAATARWARLSCTGAAQKRFLVNTPATVEPGASRNTVRSRRLALRTPAMAIPICTPATG